MAVEYARVAYIMDSPYKFLNQYKDKENLAKRSQVNIWNRTGYVTNEELVGIFLMMVDTV